MTLKTSLTTSGRGWEAAHSRPLTLGFQGQPGFPPGPSQLQPGCTLGALCHSFPSSFPYSGMC